ncbi:MAG: MFS transporter [Alphaproteobacteria bacterium]|nr:MFS transporter [Alphaproteobacteria bacterium]
MPSSDSKTAGAVTPRTLIRDRNFRHVWMAGGLGWLMRWLEMLAVGVFTFEVTQSALLVALVTMARTVPMLLFSAFTGAFADSINRRLMLLSGLGTLTVVSAILAFLALSGRIELWHLALGMFISGIYGTLEFPVRRTMLGVMAGAKAGAAGAGVAMTLDSGTNHCMRLIGPVLGGLVLQKYGLAGVYVLGTALFAVAFLLVLGVRYQTSDDGDDSPWAPSRIFAQIVDGLRYIRTNPRVMGTLYITVAMNIFGFPYGAMVPVIGDQVLGKDAVATGMLLSADAAGALLGALIIANLARPHRFARIFFFGSCIFLCAVFIFSLSQSYNLSLAMLFLAGLGVAGFAAMQSTIIFTSAPPEMRGRLMGVLAVCIGSNPIGVLQVGLLADWFGGAMSVSIMACEGLAALLLAVVIWPHFRRR